MSAAADLDGLRAHITRKLLDAPGNRRSGWRTPVLATAGASGPEARTVVLRDCYAGGLVLQVHTDRRSAKIVALDRDPRVALCFWDPDAGEQLRVGGRAVTIDEPAELDRIWRSLRPGSRLPYLLDHPPGTPLDAPPEPAAGRPGGSAAQSETGRRVFTVIRIETENWDWLEIGSGGQRRAGFRFPVQGSIEARWLAP